MTFEGLWSRNTFPHNFPDDAWRTRFSDVIGASHGGNYKFWSPHEKANEALKELAENGNTALIEEDLKVNDESIRTIIKAKGLSFPNTTGRTYAAFRVDKNRHLISLVASIIPSPDWFVGVADYELCTSDGSWLESAIYNLYPLDAGTDGGITYTVGSEAFEPPNDRQLFSFAARIRILTARWIQAIPFGESCPTVQTTRSPRFTTMRAKT